MESAALFIILYVTFFVNFLLLLNLKSETRSLKSDLEFLRKDMERNFNGIVRREQYRK
jgi:predicted Holliday junction resolvase-like endonuclease